MNNKGFTLIEILGVIVIIGLLILIVAPNLLNGISSKEEKITKLQEEMIKEAALLYADAHKGDCPSPCKVKVETLKKEGFINDNVQSVKDKTKILDDVEVTINIEDSGKTVEITD